MKSYQSKKSFIKLLCLMVIFIVIAFLFYLQHNLKNTDVALAGSEHNLSGWAWNDTVGWISFNSTNTGAGTDYGVNIDSTTGNFSGYAWSEIVGYIKFDTTDTPPGGSGADPVKINLNPASPDYHKVSGWARICSLATTPATCSGGSDGWVKMSNTSPAYGVTMDVNKNLHGYAWSENIGYISFNCVEGSASGGDICSSSDYKVAQALGGNGNVSYWAWSENIGWVSFNRKDCDADNNGLSDGVPAGCPAVGTPIADYGVNIDSVTGNFSGYAWSENIGWVSFNRSDTGNPPAAPFNGGSGPIAKMDLVTYNISGWAKILVLANDGWIKMSDDSNANWNGKGVKVDPVTNEFSGWAWNANDNGAGIGWVSFNCSDDSSCTNFNYKVKLSGINNAPTAISLSAPNWNYANASQYGALRAYLDWQFSDSDPGAAESAYQLIISTTNNPDSPVFDTGKCTDYNTPSANCKIGIPPTGVHNFPLDSSSAGFTYGTPYYWWVMVWDNYNASSSLTQYNTNPDTDNDDGNLLTFTTYKHEFPAARFSWAPLKPHKAEETKFVDASKIYLTGAPTTAVNCTSSNCAWLWTKPANATINDSATSTPTIVFTSGGTVTLKVTDNDGYWSASSTFINIGQGLPTWKEVKPQ